MNTPSSESVDIANFDDLSPVINLEVFEEEFIDLAPSTLPLPSQLANADDSTIIPAAESVQVDEFLCEHLKIDIVEVTTKRQNHISVVQNKQSEQRKWVSFRQIWSKKMQKSGF